MTDRAEVWIVDDDRSIRWVLEKAMEVEDITVRTFENGHAIIAELETSCPNVIVSDIRMPGIDGLTLMAEIKQIAPKLPIIIMTAYSDLESAVSVYEGGAFEYLPKPFDIDEAVDLVQRAISHNKENRPVEEVPDLKSEIIGEAPAMQEVFRAIGRLSQSNMTVMINGASGTGKELIAQALHQHSPRANQPFIPLNMAAIQKDLIESELFGHEKGAFTGAANQRKGHFEQAHGGTLMLDEIGDMPAEAQTRLLRVLADGEFYRVGGHNLVKVDVRIIAATHQDLTQRVEQGLFREDLFHRLNVIRIPLPNLNQRSEDIPALARHFLLTSAKELAVETKQLSSEAAAHLQKLDWPGNVRQLENVCRWLSVMGSGNQILVNDLPPELKEQTPTASLEESWQEVLSTWAKKELQFGQQQLLDKALPAFEKVMIKAALKHTHGRRREAAELLGWGRNTLTRKISELGL